MREASFIIPPTTTNSFLNKNLPDPDIRHTIRGLRNIPLPKLVLATQLYWVGEMRRYGKIWIKLWFPE